MKSTPTYRVIIRQLNGGSIQMAWDCKTYGRPTETNAQRFLDTFNASLQPGGANSHLGSIPGMKAMKVLIETNCREPETIAQAETPLFTTCF